MTGMVQELRSRAILLLDRVSDLGESFPKNTGQGSAGNVISALASFFIPGLGQLIQGRLFAAILFFLCTGILWVFLMGWVMHLWSCLDAALWKPRA